MNTTGYTYDAWANIIALNNNTARYKAVWCFKLYIYLNKSIVDTT
jgi:hypothetical protein